MEGVIFQIEFLHVLIQVLERTVSSHHILVGTSIIHDEKFPAQMETAYIMS